MAICENAYAVTVFGASLFYFPSTERKKEKSAFFHNIVNGCHIACGNGFGIVPSAVGVDADCGKEPENLLFYAFLHWISDGTFQPLSTIGRKAGEAWKTVEYRHFGCRSLLSGCCESGIV